MVFEKLEDLLEIETDTLKVADMKRLFSKIKQEVRKSYFAGKDLSPQEKDLSALKYTAVSVIGNTLYRIAFNPETKDAVVVHSITDDRGNHMAVYLAEKVLLNEIGKQK